MLAVLGSLMVSYTRARAEALGVECKVGIATRPVRVVILSIGLVFAKGAGIFDVELLAPAIYAMAALTAFTVVQRVWHVRGELRALDEPEAVTGTRVRRSRRLPTRREEDFRRNEHRERIAQRRSRATAT